MAAKECCAVESVLKTPFFSASLIAIRLSFFSQNGGITSEMFEAKFELISGYPEALLR
jgi:hypothetical protein